MAALVQNITSLSTVFQVECRNLPFIKEATFPGTFGDICLVRTGTHDQPELTIIQQVSPKAGHILPSPGEDPPSLVWMAAFRKWNLDLPGLRLALLASSAEGGNGDGAGRGNRGNLDIPCV